MIDASRNLIPSLLENYVNIWLEDWVSLYLIMVWGSLWRHMVFLDTNLHILFVVMVDKDSASIYFEKKSIATTINFSWLEERVQGCPTPKFWGPCCDDLMERFRWVTCLVYKSLAFVTLLDNILAIFMFVDQQTKISRP